MVYNTVLALSPHTDDCEVGCGATLFKLAQAGAEITYVAFSPAIRSLPEGVAPLSTIAEVQKATEILGVKRLLVRDFRVRDFPAYRQEILEYMTKLNHDLTPDIILLPSRTDTHQDHIVVCQEGYRAFKTHSILGYETLWNSANFAPNVFMSITKPQLAKKLEAVRCYQSQKMRMYGGLKILRELASVRGATIKQPYAEGFELIRWIMK